MKSSQGAVAVIALFLCLLGACAQVEEKDAKSAALRYLPHDVSVLACADPRTLLASPLVAGIRRLASETSPESSSRDPFDLLQARLALDLSAEVDWMVAGVGDGGARYGLVHGSFDGVKRISERSPDLAPPEDVDGYPVVRNRGVSIICISRTLLAVVSDRELEARMIRLAEGDDPSLESNERMKALIMSAEPAHAIWGCGIPSATAVESAANSNPMFGALTSLVSYRFAADFDPDLALTIAAEGRDEQAAAKIHATIEQLLGLGRLFSSSEPELAALLDDITNRREQKIVTFHCAFPPDEVMAALQKHGTGKLWKAPDQLLAH